MTNPTPEQWELGIEQLERVERYLSKNWLDDELPLDAVWSILVDKPLGDSKQEVTLPC